MGSHRNGFTKENYIVAVDVGTTSIKCHVYDEKAVVKGSCIRKVAPIYPKPGWVEMDPEELWRGFLDVVKGAVEDSGLEMKQMQALGISTQRATFTTWDRHSGKPFHNFITWQDLRSADLVRAWNGSMTLKLIHGVSSLLHLLTRQKMFQAASILVFSTQHITLRLVWVLQNYPKVQAAVANGTCFFGTIDTWLLYKLTKGSVHATDYSNASSTGIFDTYQMCWSGTLCSIVSLPLSIFPTVHNTGHYFGCTDESIFGVSVPIMSVMADQQAATFGECCFDKGDVKITMGTGTFMDINTGNKPHTSFTGLYPVVGWKIGADVTYLAEGNAADTGTAIRWAKELDLFSDVDETGEMAGSVKDSDGVCFVPSFSGLQAPLNDPRACASFMGLKPTTTRNHLVRAILESVAFRIKQLYDIMLRETQIPVTKIRADGGVCSNNFVMQLTADLLGRSVDRPSHFDMSSLGVAFVAGLAVGFWSSYEELKCLRRTERVFLPRSTSGTLTHSLRRWERALKRSMHWLRMGRNLPFQVGTASLDLKAFLSNQNLTKDAALTAGPEGSGSVRLSGGLTGDAVFYATAFTPPDSDNGMLSYF
ncbi:putative glycerol kinase 5 [Chanos chanos]|uniref:Glycerol kinase 5 n=1 Tax=Chanos chanos TaxID=29144 RepID=A0A6J2VQ16_CHACN|nr:putative glycerol kinase 5 [Chanos chanos]